MICSSARWAGKGYIDLVGQSVEPAAPVAGTIRLHGETSDARTFPEFTNESGVMVVLGRDSVFIAKNTSGGAITKGQVVYINGASGNKPTVGLAKADAIATISGTIGVVAEATIANNGFGHIMMVGVIPSIDTSAFTAGDGLYVSAVTAGARTNVAPAYPNFQKRIGSVLTSGVGNGSMLINSGASWVYQHLVSPDCQFPVELNFYPLWMAAYPLDGNESKEEVLALDPMWRPKMPPGAQQPTIWQYTSHKRVDGISATASLDVDMGVFFGHDLTPFRDYVWSLGVETETQKFWRRVNEFFRAGEVAEAIYTLASSVFASPSPRISITNQQVINAFEEVYGEIYWFELEKSLGKEFCADMVADGNRDKQFSDLERLPEAVRYVLFG